MHLCTSAGGQRRRGHGAVTRTLARGQICGVPVFGSLTYHSSLLMVRPNEDRVRKGMLVRENPGIFARYGLRQRGAAP